MHHLPFILTTFRLILAPGVVLLATGNTPGWLFVVCLFAALLSDYFDGMIGRKYQCITPFLRRYDSLTDGIFYFAVLTATYLRHESAILMYASGILIILILEIIRYLFDFIKFHKVASYHMYSAKCWHVALFLAFVALLGYEVSEPFFPIAIVLGVISDLEGLLASVILPKPVTDVPTLYHAYHLRHTPSA